MSRGSPQGPLVLAVDTAARRSSVALADTTGLLCEGSLGEDGCRAEALADLVAGLLREISANPIDVSALAAVTGPGSYTGLRIGLALVRGIAAPDDLPVVAIGALELLALAADGCGRAERVALSDAGRGNCYLAAYRVDGAEVQELAPPQTVACDEVAERLQGLGLADWPLCTDNLPAVLAGALRADVARDRASVAARVGCQRLVRGGGVTAEAVLPVYVGAGNARPNRNRVRANPAVIRGYGTSGA